MCKYRCVGGKCIRCSVGYGVECGVECRTEGGVMEYVSRYGRVVRLGIRRYKRGCRRECFGRR